MATDSNALAWRIPGTRQLGGLPSMGSQSQARLKETWWQQHGFMKDFPKVDFQKISHANKT